MGLPALPGASAREASAPEGGSQALITFSARLASLERLSDLAERLPKALIHRNVPGEPVCQFFRDFDRAWDSAAPYSAFGPRQRWLAAVTALNGAWPVIRRPPPRGGHRRWRLGEVSLPWDVVVVAPPLRPQSRLAFCRPVPGQVNPDDLPVRQPFDGPPDGEL
jgi:hypothetical protein